jgi:uncharacterized membrane protein YraQ (UPF0718 family)
MGTECAHCAYGTGRPFYRERLFQVAVFLAAGFLVSLFYEPLQPLYSSFYEYLKLIWWAILLGLVIGGIIDYFIPNELVSKYLGCRKKSSIPYAIGLGFLFSVCSHGILAISMEFYRKGASISSVVTFLLASPWANFVMTLLLFSFFGVKAFVIIISAIGIAITTGFVFMYFEERGWVEKNPSTIEECGAKIKIRRGSSREMLTGVARGSWSLTKMVLWWVLLGMFLASIAGAYIPHDIFEGYLGPTGWGLLLTLLLATAIEVCSEGSSPIAFEIYKRTGAFGNSFAFLMAGVATDYTEIGLIASNVGKKSAILLPLVTVPQILVLGWLFNIFL